VFLRLAIKTFLRHIGAMTIDGRSSSLEKQISTIGSFSLFLLFDHTIRNALTIPQQRLDDFLHRTLLQASKQAP